MTSLSLKSELSTQLLTRDPTRRLGSGKEDAEEIKKQPFFKDVNFDDVLNKRIPPPYFPTIVSCAFGYTRTILNAYEHRMGVPIPVISTRNLLENNLPLPLYTGSCRPKTRRNLMDFLG